MGATLDPSWNPLKWWRAIRAVRRLQADQNAAIPAELRPPPGKSLDANSAASWLVPLDGTLDRQEILKAICEIGGNDNYPLPEQPTRGWLALRCDETDAVRIAVLVGTEVIGFLHETESFLHETESGALRSRIETQERRGESLWVDVFFEIENGRYAADVSIP
jgi:hypothetical protein